MPKNTFAGAYATKQAAINHKKSLEKQGYSKVVVADSGGKLPKSIRYGVFYGKKPKPQTRKQRITGMKTKKTSKIAGHVFNTFTSLGR